MPRKDRIISAGIKVPVPLYPSGLISKVTGGKFANRAVTGAFVYLFNHELDEMLDSSDKSVPKQ